MSFVRPVKFGLSALKASARPPAHPTDRRPNNNQLKASFAAEYISIGDQQQPLRFIDLLLVYRWRTRLSVCRASWCVREAYKCSESHLGTSESGIYCTEVESLSMRDYH